MTFIFRSGNLAERRENGQTISMHHKNDVLDMLKSEVEKNNLKKAVFIDYGDFRTSYVYAFSTRDEYGTKDTIKVYVEKRTYDPYDPYTAQLNLLVDLGVKIKKLNRTKAVLVGLTFSLLVGASTFSMMYAFNKDAEISEGETKEYVENINDQRAENDLPPLEYNYESDEAIIDKSK